METPSPKLKHPLLYFLLEFIPQIMLAERLKVEKIRFSMINNEI